MYLFHLTAGCIGYLLGAIPFGFLVARAYGVNIFEVGSKNPGATNVKRVLGAKAGNTVFALDALKGAFASGWPGAFAWFSVSDASAAWPLSGVIGLLASLLGHSFSCFTGFRGGKGVATAAGGFLVLIPVPTLIAGAVWVISFYATRYVSLASIFAALSIGIAAWVFSNSSVLLPSIATAVGLFVVFRHRSNIVRLLNGTENRFTKKTPPSK